VHAEPLQQLLQTARLQYEFDVFAGQERPEEVVLEVARQRGDRADAQHLAVGRLAIAQHGHQFVAGGEDRLGVVQRHAPGFGQLHAASRAYEQRLADLLLELPDLRRQCRLRDVQMRRCARQVAFLGNGPEVVQVVVVEMGHVRAAFCKTER
jgi:hypothetical protein